jgi:hypothetical protein
MPSTKTVQQPARNNTVRSIPDALESMRLVIASDQREILKLHDSSIVNGDKILEAVLLKK